MEEKLKIEDLGYNSFFETGKKQLGLGDFSHAYRHASPKHERGEQAGVARVISEHKGAYRVKNTNGEYLAKITGKKIFKATTREDYPAVGDWVLITELDNSHAVIHGILPRFSIIKRRYGDKNKVGEKDKLQIIAANIDIVFVVESVDRDYNLNRFERYFTIAENGGVKPAIILNKVDLLSKEEMDGRLIELKNRFPGIDIIRTSTVDNESLGELKKYIIKGKTYCFLGSSGVGKSSLINKLLGEGAIKTGDISFYSGRGKHITTARQLYLLQNGGIVIDNPGIREVGMADASQGIDAFFEEITALAQNCKYTDCTHTHEPGCEVTGAIKSGKLDEGKYRNYINLKKEAEYYNMSDGQKREKNRQFGKFKKKVKQGLKGV